MAAAAPSSHDGQELLLGWLQDKVEMPRIGGNGSGDGRGGRDFRDDLALDRKGHSNSNCGGLDECVLHHQLS